MFNGIGRTVWRAMCLVAAFQICGSNEVTVTPVTSVYAIDGVQGYTTYRLSVVLGKQLHNCYTIAGTMSGHPSRFPPARQVPAPFGTNTGGTNPAYWPYKSETQYDSWLTVGTTNGDNALGHIDIPFQDWDESTELSFDNGAVFWMKPDAAPNSSQPIVIAQITVPTGTIFSAVVGLMQGRRHKGEDWDAFDTKFTNQDPALTVAHSRAHPAGIARAQGLSNVRNQPLH